MRVAPMRWQDSSYSEEKLRIIIAAMQISLGLLIIFEGSLVLVQSRINHHWEAGFYGEASPLAIAVTLWSLCIIGVGVCTTGVGIGYAKLGISGQWVLFSSLILMCVVPEPIAWMLLATSMLVVFDRWSMLRRQDPG